MSVHFLAEKRNDNTQITPRELLQFAIAEVDAGRVKPIKALLLYMEPHEGGFHLGYFASNLTNHEHISILEMHKARVIRETSR